MTTSVSMGGTSAMMPMPPPRSGPDAARLGDKLISQVDSDGDGSLSKAEFTAMLGSIGTDGATQDVDADAVDGLYAGLDADGDGTLSATEVTDAISALLEQMRSGMGRNDTMGSMPPPPPPGGDGEKLFAELDADGSGAVDEAEFSAMLQHGPAAAATDSASLIASMFADADSDGDGSLTRDELQAARPGPPASPGPDRGAAGESGEDSLSPVIRGLLDRYTANAAGASVSGGLSVTA